MPKFIIMPEGCKWSEREAVNHEAAYSLECSWYKPKTRVCVLDAETGAAQVFTREIEPNGNLIKVNKHIKLCD